jgi:hypothetical protein
MQERSAIWTEEAVRALNVIDVVFYDSRPVREAWAALLHTLGQQPLPPLHAQQDRIKDLLAAMAVDLGLADDIRTDDLHRIYVPTPLAQDRFIQQQERQERFTRLQQVQGQPAANTSPAGSIWPPPP